ncbi:cobalt ECF transporter T component CbiQ [Oscillospiraceae bacterium WX1]
MSHIDQYAYQSKLAPVKAGTKLLYALTVMAICLFSGSELVSVLTIIIMSAVTLLLGGCRWQRYMRLLTIPLTFLVTGTITVIITRLRPTDVSIVSISLFGGIYGISAASLDTGIMIFLRALGAVTCLYFFSLNTPMNAFLSLLRRKAPGLFVELMELIYRFIFVIWEEAGKIHTAQASRLGYDGFKRSMASLAELVTSVFLRAFRRVDRVNVALASRGFDGNFELLTEREAPSRILTALTLATVTVLTAAAILERLYL